MAHDDDTLSDEELTTYFGALAAMANADGHLSEGEIALFRERLEHRKLPVARIEALTALLSAPPEIGPTLEAMRDSPARFALYLDLYAMGKADDDFDVTELAYLYKLDMRLKLEPRQTRAIQRLVDLIHSGRTGDLQPAIDELKEEGVPMSAIRASTLAGTVGALAVDDEDDEEGSTGGLVSMVMGLFSRR